MKTGTIEVSHGRKFRAKLSHDAKEICDKIGYGFYHHAEVGLYILLEEYGYFYPCNVVNFIEDTP